MLRRHLPQPQFPGQCAEITRPREDGLAVRAHGQSPDPQRVRDGRADRLAGRCLPHPDLAPTHGFVATRSYETLPVGAEGDSIDIDDALVLHGVPQAMGFAAPNAQVRPDDALEVRFAVRKLSQASRQAENSLGNLALLAEMETGVQGQCRRQFLGLMKGLEGLFFRLNRLLPRGGFGPGGLRSPSDARSPFPAKRR